MISAAPRRSRTSVNPPVEAPASSARRPSTGAPNASRAPSSLWAPRETQLGWSGSVRTTTGVPASTPVAGFVAARPETATRPSAINATACSRDRASPRRTSSASSRLRRTIRAGRSCRARAGAGSARPRRRRRARRPGARRGRRRRRRPRYGARTPDRSRTAQRWAAGLAPAAADPEPVAECSARSCAPLGWVGWPRAPAAVPVRSGTRLPAADDGKGQATGALASTPVPPTQLSWRHTRVATMDQCMTALKGILGDLASNPAADGLDRSLSCRLTDLDQIVLGRLGSGAVRDLTVQPYGPDVPRADIRLTMTSEDLVALTDGKLNFGQAWMSGRVKLEAGVRDLLRLRKLL